MEMDIVGNTITNEIGSFVDLEVLTEEKTGEDRVTEVVEMDTVGNTMTNAIGSFVNLKVVTGERKEGH